MDKNWREPVRLTDDQVSTINTLYRAHKFASPRKKFDWKSPRTGEQFEFSYNTLEPWYKAMIKKKQVIREYVSLLNQIYTYFTSL